MPIHPARGPVAVERDGERSEDVNVFLYAAAAPGEVADLSDDALQIVHRDFRIPVADRIHPEDPVAPRQPDHDVLLAERVAVPVVAEADDVPSFDHSNSRAAGCTPSGLFP